MTDGGVSWEGSEGYSEEGALLSLSEDSGKSLVPDAMTTLGEHEPCTDDEDPGHDDQHGTAQDPESQTEDRVHGGEALSDDLYDIEHGDLPLLSW